MPIVALLPAIIGAAGAIGGSLINKSASKNLYGSSSSSSGSSLLPPGLDTTALTGLIGQQKDLAGSLTSSGADLLSQGSDILGGPIQFNQAMLGGDRTAIMENRAPEIAAINAQFRQPLAEAGITGLGSGLQGDIEASRQSGISNAIFGARPAASDKLTQISQALMNLSTTQTGLGANVLGQAAGEVLDYNALIRGLQQRDAESQANSNTALFGLLGTTLGPVLQTILRGSSGGTNPSAPPIAFPTPNPTVPDPPIPLPSGMSALTTSNQGKPTIDAGWLADMMGGKSPATR